MINFDDITMEVIKRHQQNWRKIPDHSSRIFIIGGSRQKETNALFNLLRHQLVIIYILSIHMKQNSNY